MYTMIAEVGLLLATPCYLACTMITEVGSMLTTPCYLTCSTITEACSLLTILCYLTCTMITEVGSLLTTPCYVTYTMMPQVCLLLNECIFSLQTSLTLWSLFSLLSSDFAAATVLITFGALLGKTSPLQMLVIALIEIVAFSVNEWVGVEHLKVSSFSFQLAYHIIQTN